MTDKPFGIKELATFAGITFFANLLAIFGVVSFLLSPVKSATDANAKAVAIVRSDFHKHESKTGHEGMVELFNLQREHLNERFNRLEELVRRADERPK